jgi:hypothetical protein
MNNSFKIEIHLKIYIEKVIVEIFSFTPPEKKFMKPLKSIFNVIFN